MACGGAESCFHGGLVQYKIEVMVFNYVHIQVKYVNVHMGGKRTVYGETETVLRVVQNAPSVGASTA